MARIAIVEDEDTVASSLAYGLRRLGHDVDVFAEGTSALQSLVVDRRQLIILDVMLDGVDGLEICRRIREVDTHTPILMLTARGDEVDRVAGLEAGADDYVVKPFGMLELEARVKGMLRRSGAIADAPVARGAFFLDPRKGVCRVQEQPVALTPRQLELLWVLLSRCGQVVPREELLAAVWGPDYAGEAKTLDVHIRWLREKIEPDAAQPRYIFTVRGQGYRLEAE